MENRKKILLACPVSEYKDYILPQWMSFVNKTTFGVFDKVDILLVDNSISKQHFRKLNAFPSNRIKVIHRPPFRNERINDTMKECLNIIRDYVIENEYDYFFSLECDIFPESNLILKELLSHKKDVVSACYNIGFGETRRLMLQYPFKKENGNVDARNVDLSGGFKAITGELLKVFGCGLGCTLIKRSVLEDYRFRTDPGLVVHADTFFHIDLWERDYESFLDTSLFCRHYNSDWSSIKKIHDKKRLK